VRFYIQHHSVSNIREWLPGMVDEVNEHKAVEESEERLSAIFTHAAVGLSEISLEGRFLRVNNELCRQLGRSQQTLLQLGVPDVTHPDYIDRSIRTLQGVIRTGKSDRLDKRYVRPDGTLVWASSSLTRLDDHRGCPDRILVVTVDLTDRMLAEEALRESETRFRALADLSPDGILVVHDGIYRYANAAALHLLGAGNRDDILGRKLLDFVTPECRLIAREQFSRHSLEKQKPGKGLIEQTWRRLGGGSIELEVSAGRTDWEGHDAVQIILRDITERKHAELQIWRHANFDALTGLPNRRLFQDRLAQEIRKAHQHDRQVALFYLDLDGFKRVNDLLGHKAGDELLVRAARRVDASVRKADTVARVGGDEFTIILGDLTGTGRVDEAAQAIIDTLAEPYQLGEEQAYITASLGITLYPDDALNADELTRTADQAMYTAKRTGKNQFAYFTREMDVVVHRRLRMANELRRAMERNQFHVHYQPMVDLRSGHVVKAEALLRWQHPSFGLVSPTSFIPLAEEAGLIGEIGDWVFRQAADSVKRWRGQGNRSFQVSVNKSPLQFRPMHDGSRWLGYMQSLGLPGNSITVEITEGVLLDVSSSVHDSLLAYQDAGIEVAIDDFGTGYSSLSYLKKFHIDYLKIDQSFISDMAENSTNRTIAETIIVMAHRLGLGVIAEGIETERQLSLLREAGCDYGQGFLFSKPLTTAGFEQLLSQPRAPKPRLRQGYQDHQNSWL